MTSRLQRALRGYHDPGTPQEKPQAAETPPKTEYHPGQTAEALSGALRALAPWAHSLGHDMDAIVELAQQRQAQLVAQRPSRHITPANPGHLARLLGDLAETMERLAMEDA